MMRDPGVEAGRKWFLAGLFLCTAGLLALELINVRLLSVLTWYHLSFFAVSMAMFGMSAGAVHVYLAGERYRGERAAPALERYARRFAAAIPIAHLLNLCLPIRIELNVTAIASGLFSTLALALPFYLAGVMVALALTRIPGPAGAAYAADLAGAALGCLAAIPLLRLLNVSSAVFAAGALAALGAWCFGKYRGLVAGASGPAPAGGRTRQSLWLAASLTVLALVNAATLHGFRPLSSKGRSDDIQDVTFDGSNEFSTVTTRPLRRGQPFFWGAAMHHGLPELGLIWMLIDGYAATGMTGWSGDLGSLDWVRHDVTSLPYHLRPGGTAAIIGIGGGRDVLSALWGRSRSITAIEVNDLFLRLLREDLREFAGVAKRPEVEWVHAEARSYLARSDRRFDVLQMSLIDTWAATGAGAFTLTENGLYTREGFAVLLERLGPGGLLSVSRWFDPERVSETSRLLGLATAALLDRGVTDPSRCLALVSVGKVATLLLSATPLGEGDLARIQAVAAAEQFRILLLPGQPAALPSLATIAGSRSLVELEHNLAHPDYDYRPPTDERPYFFNMLRPRAVPAAIHAGGSPGVIGGNLVATATLLLLAGISAALVLATVLVPLSLRGRPDLDRASFRSALGYFAGIGAGFMLVQMAFLQRFAVYLGHPVWALVAVLGSMILFAGIGSYASDRIALDGGTGDASGAGSGAPSRWRSPMVRIPLALAALLAALVVLLPRLIAFSMGFSLGVRLLVVTAVVAPLSLLLGTLFPLGLRRVAPMSAAALPWMWGVNGAFGVLASVAAVVISMWWGIRWNLAVAALLYAAIAWPGARLARSDS